MVADPHYDAIRIYRSLGFTDGAPHAEATLLPDLTGSEMTHRSG